MHKKILRKREHGSASRLLASAGRMTGESSLKESDGFEVAETLLQKYGPLFSSNNPSSTLKNWMIRNSTGEHSDFRVEGVYMTVGNSRL